MFIGINKELQFLLAFEFSKKMSDIIVSIRAFFAHYVNLNM